MFRADLDQLTDEDPPDDGEPDGPGAWHQRAAEAEAIDPALEGGFA